MYTSQNVLLFWLKIRGWLACWCGTHRGSLNFSHPSRACVTPWSAGPLWNGFLAPWLRPCDHGSGTQTWFSFASNCVFSWRVLVQSWPCRMVSWSLSCWMRPIWSFLYLTGLRCVGHLMLACAACAGGFWIWFAGSKRMLNAPKVLHAYPYGTRPLPCFPKHFERMCAGCVNTGSNIDCRRKRVAALSVPFENIILFLDGWMTLVLTCFDILGVDVLDILERFPKKIYTWSL